MNMHVAHALLQTPDRYITREAPGRVEFSYSDQLGVTYDAASRAIWSRWNPEPRPCFNPTLLEDLRAYYDFLRNSHAQIRCGAEFHPIEYAVQASATPGFFNLGGDLDLFRKLIETRDRATLLHYGRTCVDLVYQIYTAYGQPLTTIALVQGECLGGGFESALSNQIIVAEKSARFGFPEILFNLFPGMGAYSFLARKVGQKITEEMLSGGKVYSADDMLAMGVVDAVAEDGQGEAAVAALIKRRQRAANGLSALSQVRRRVNPVTHEELVDVVGLWVDSALRLTPRDLKLMQRLVSRQNGLGDSQQLH